MEVLIYLFCDFGAACVSAACGTIGTVSMRSSPRTSSKHQAHRLKQVESSITTEHCVISNIHINPLNRIIRKFSGSSIHESKTTVKGLSEQPSIICLI